MKGPLKIDVTGRWTAGYRSRATIGEDGPADLRISDFARLDLKATYRLFRDVSGRRAEGARLRRRALRPFAERARVPFEQVHDVGPQQGFLMSPAFARKAAAASGKDGVRALLVRAPARVDDPAVVVQDQVVAAALGARVTTSKFGSLH